MNKNKKIKRGMKKLVLIPLVCSLAMSSLAGCANKGGVDTQQTLDTATREIRQNDYRGSTVRTVAIRDKMIETIDKMKEGNIIIRNENPNSFWSSEDYQDFVSNFLNIAIINDTMLFNEEETDWQMILSTIATTQNSFTKKTDNGFAIAYPNLDIKRVEKDEYSITGITGYTLDKDAFGQSLMSGLLSYNIYYDCDKDWAKALANLNAQIEGVPNVTAQMYEFRRLSDDAFAIQTSKERIYIEFEALKKDAPETATGANGETASETVAETSAANGVDVTDLRNREIKTFYYSKLVNDGMRTTYKPYQALPEVDEMGIYNQENKLKNDKFKKYYFLNEDGDLFNRYGRNDSVYFESNQMDWKDWVFEDKALQQAFVYENKILVINTYNKLSESYEQFIYGSKDAKEEVVNEAKDLVLLDSLVGIVKPEISAYEPESEEETTEEPTEDESSEAASGEDIPSETTEQVETTVEPTTEKPTEKPTETKQETTPASSKEIEESTTEKYSYPQGDM